MTSSTHRIAGFVFVLALLCCWTTSGQMVIHHINVGQGDSTLIEFKKAAILVDAGGSRRKETKQHLLSYLDRFFEKRPDLNHILYSVIITHPHQDHTIYLKDVLYRYRVWNFVDNGDDRNGSKNGTVETLREVRKYIADANRAHPNFMTYDAIKATDIGPLGFRTQWFKQLNGIDHNIGVTFLNASRDCKTQNNDSVVVRVDYGKSSILITGDSEDRSDTVENLCTPAIDRMMARYQQGGALQADIYKVGHHGATNGSNPAFMGVVRPQISIVSAGRSNESDAIGYGHPNLGILGLLNSATSRSGPARTVPGFTGKAKPGTANMNKAIYCTCWDGDIVLTAMSSGTISVKTEN